MSKIKSPDDKKRLSFAKDRRNTYGENSKSSRKNIPRSKQRSHMSQRRGAADALRSAGQMAVDEDLDVLEAQLRLDVELRVLSGFRKTPDRPLGAVVERKLARRKRLKMTGYTEE